jgi:holo-[acyl-carrier protein] synthase
MLLGVGTDILHLPRLKALIGRRSQGLLARRILSTHELEVFASLPDCDAARRVRFLAVRYIQTYRMD